MKRCVLAAALVALTGCGTVQNFERTDGPGTVPYGGVVIAAERFRAKPSDGGFIRVDFPNWLSATDVVLSAIGDTVSLPVAVAVCLWQIDKALTEQNPPPNSGWRQFWGKEATTAPDKPAAAGAPTIP